MEIIKRESSWYITWYDVTKSRIHYTFIKVSYMSEGIRNN